MPPLRSLLFSLLVPPLLGFYVVYALELHLVFPALTDPRALGQLFLQSFFYVFKPPIKITGPIKWGPAAPFMRHIVAVGDLHGDLPNARRVLQFAGVADEFGNWTGNADFFVQTGDIIDR